LFTYVTILKLYTYVPIYMYIYYMVYVECITGYGEGMGRVRVFGDGDYKIILAPYPSGFSSYPTIPATIGENSGLSPPPYGRGRGGYPLDMGKLPSLICIGV